MANEPLSRGLPSSSAFPVIVVIAIFEMRLFLNCNN